MRTLYLVTHPEASHHVDGLVGGWFDSRLTPMGESVAQKLGVELAARVAEPSHARLYSSDLLRTSQTAQHISAALQITPTFDVRLREKSYGIAEGKPQAWFRARFVPPEAIGPRLHHDEGLPGAETMYQFGERIYACVTEILSHDSAEQIVVCHGGALTFVAAAFLRLPLDNLGFFRIRSVPGTLTVLREDDYFHNRTLIELNSPPRG